MSDYPTQQPHIASYMVLKNEEGKVAFVLRSNTQWMNGYYTLPTGKVENDESYTACAVRETKEEVGVSVKPSNLSHLLTMHRQEAELNNADWVDVYFSVSKWEGEPQNAEPDVHGEFIWLDTNKLPDNIVPNVRFALEQIEAGNHYCEYLKRGKTNDL